MKTTWLCLVTLTCTSTLTLAEDWPQWRGAGRDGVWNADTASTLDQLPDGQMPLEWSTEIGPGYSGPTVAGGLVYVMDRQLTGGETERILCLNSSTGEIQWQHEYAAPYTISYKAGPRASVTIDGDRAYAVGAMGHMHCLKAKTGEVVWSRNLEQDYQVELPIWGISASPLIYKNLVIEQVGSTNGACIVAFDKLSGDEVWKSLSERAGYSSPILIEQAGQDVVVCWTGESLSGLDPTSGELHWRHEMLPSRMPIGIGTPTVNGELIFVSSFYDGSLMVRAPKDALTSELVWRAVGIDEKSTGSHTVQTASGEQIDADAVYGVHAMIGTSIIKNDRVYCVDSHGEFRCLEAMTGKRLWEDDRAVPRNRWATIHMVQQEQRVWMFNEAGELLITNLSPEGLSILDRADLIETTKEQLPRRDGVCWSHPAFAELAIFARNDNRIVRASLAAKSSQ